MLCKKEKFTQILAKLGKISALVAGWPQYLLAAKINRMAGKPLDRNGQNRIAMREPW